MNNYLSLPASERFGGSPVVLLEFNELSPTLMDRFIEGGHLPNFRKLRAEAQAYVSDAEELAPNLEPWIQWVTVHSGLSFKEHGVFHLGEGHKLAAQSIWDIASANGLGVCVCGSMNVNYELPINGVVIPDPWSAAMAPWPPEIKAYLRFVQANVQEHTNERVGLSIAEVLRFLGFMGTHGLSMQTVSAIFGQLAKERLGSGSRWKRATILDKLQRDVFLHYLREIEPDFSTFFLNSTAHFQHLHWRNMDPEPFTVKPTDAEQVEYGEAILYGYREMDQLLGDIIKAVPDHAVVLLATGLSQQPCLTYENIGGKTFYRPREIADLLGFAGIQRWAAIEPVMSEEFRIRFATDSEAHGAAAHLRGLALGGRKAMRAEANGNTVLAGCNIHEVLAASDLMLEAGSGRPSVPFLQLFYQAEGTKSGMHHPTGILWMRVPGISPRVHHQPVSLRAVAPTILSFLGLKVPSRMTGPVLAPGGASEMAAG